MYHQWNQAKFFHQCYLLIRNFNTTHLIQYDIQIDIIYGKISHLSHTHTHTRIFLSSLLLLSLGVYRILDDLTLPKMEKSNLLYLVDFHYYKLLSSSSSCSPNRSKLAKNSLRRCFDAILLSFINSK